MERMSKQLILSGKLKPEVRLGIEISNFAQSLDDERREEFRRMQTAKGIHLSGWDVIRVTEEINQEGSRRHRVWSALRLSLTIATNYMSYFEKLSTLFMRLGTSWALHEDFAQLFPRSEILQTYFCEYLVVLMKLCNKVVVFGQKNTGAQLFSSLGSSFDSEFGTIQKELDQWGNLIQQQCQVLAMKIATGAKDSRSQDAKQRILRRLSPHQGDFETRWRRQRKKGTCEWMFDTPSFKDWKSMQTSATLCISGKLGCGKTVSMANLVARVDLEKPCAYAFCASQEPTSLKAANILGSIAFSLLDLPPEAMIWGDAEQFDAMINTFDPESIINFVLGLLPVDRTFIIIVDGLEDCSGADITDVISGLRRLAQNRVVLLCYSSRSDSRFQLVAKQHFEPKFLISPDDVNHDAELESYIVEEVTKRNTTRQLSPHLEELVKKQLIIGAQGMYLWASLQLDTIFPANSNVVITDDRILNLITHLPKDLPEAFERALEGITDRQYEGRIMKLVMAAVTPLDLDDIRVALCVVPGEPVWRPERIAKDGTQLISLCGGNLLELDEEDGKVRFIHHSVIQHLLSPARSENTTSYHFSAEAAENYIGATCITYLHLPVLDSRVTVTRNLQSAGVLDNVIGTTQESLPGIQATRIQQDLDPRCFAPYATSHWVFHTRFFDENIRHCKESWGLWWRLLKGGVATVKPPCADLEERPYSGLVWAVENAHGSLFRNILSQRDLAPGHEAEVVRALELHKSIRGQWLGDFLVRYLLSLHSNEIPSNCDKITLLLDLGADPVALHSVLQCSPIQILTTGICTGALSAEDEERLIREILFHASFQGALKDDSLLDALERLLDRHKLVAIAVILALRPDLKYEFHRIQAKGLSEKSAIERALDDERWEEVENLASQGLVNTPTFDGKSLLWRAIEVKSDAWVYHLLRLGADPNIGPFEMIHDIRSPGFVATCYPLEAALWLRRTRVCLELLRHKVDIDRLGGSLIRIAENQPDHQRISKHGHTALAMACKMLSRSISDEPPGFRVPFQVSDLAEDWKSKLEKIIYRLALDEDAEYVNAQDAEGRTALHYLAETKNTDSQMSNTLVNVLLSRGADPNLPDCHGETPLWLAVRNAASVNLVVEPLMEAGAVPTRACLSYFSSILKEAMMAYSDTDNQDVIRLVRLLLQAGADPRVQVPWTLAHPDPSLVSLAATRGMQCLVKDFMQHTKKLNGPSVEEESDLQ
ncbi:hypothetical protein INS49_012189 [Diaporthe citri]|uniref:uncharacterized protein n=1 Tax=Diaporthe citri TaxID=83186 RepID=UPI001C822BE7|nr:uncharacterized protein INS49_012189 [Diaporthe citri]KAG6358671.1 hypothetical protein INS49_012189 [Diaporthe citri]